MRIVILNRLPIMAAIIALGFLMAASAGLAMAYDSGPPKRIDFQGSMQPPVEEGATEYIPAPPRRIDFQGQKRAPGPEAQSPAYVPGPPKRIDFQGTRRIETDRLVR
jgi:hypothetical protein